MQYAYIFDFDGVLADTMEAHFKAYQEALREAKVPIDKKQFFYQAGMTGKEQIKYFAGKAKITVDVEKVYARKGQLYEKNIDHITIIECNLKLLNTLRKSGFPVAIASGSSRRSIMRVLNKYKIEVDAVTTAEDVKRGKPYPDLFLCAAEKIGAGPENCMVIEDSDVGIDAAGAAGMKAMRFYNND